MFSIYDGRTSFYQWDIDRKLIVEDSTIKQVHFCNKTDDCSLVCETFTEDGRTIVNVPNILLQSDWRINVYAYDGKATKHSATFDVVGRTKPSDYIYTETEVKTYEEYEERLSALENKPEVESCGLNEGLHANTIDSEYTTAGLKGFYWTSIEYYSEDNETIINLSTRNRIYGEWKQFDIKNYWAVGDVISIHSGAKYYNVATIKNLDGDMIAIKGQLSFTVDWGIDEPTDMAVYVLTKPDKGLVDFGHGAFAYGVQSNANNLCATAFGARNNALGQYAFAAGRDNTVFHGATAFGRENTVKGEQSLASGYLNTVSGNNSGAIGRENTVGGAYAFATGISNKVGSYSFAGGSKNNASGGSCTVAFGENNNLYGSGHSFACGKDNTATGSINFVSGKGNTVSGQYSYAEGSGNKSSGESSHAEGLETIASNKCAHAEGSKTQALGLYSHSEGDNSIAYGRANHAEGYFTVAGISTNTNGIAGAHAEGHSTQATAQCAHAEGKGTIASAMAQHAGGTYNIADTTSLVIIGNGTDTDHRNNAYTLSNEGNGWFAGTVEATAVILRSPNGTKFRLSVDNNGAITTAKV